MAYTLAWTFEGLGKGEQTFTNSVKELGTLPAQGGKNKSGGLKINLELV